MYYLYYYFTIILTYKLFQIVLLHLFCFAKKKKKKNDGLYSALPYTHIHIMNAFSTLNPTMSLTTLAERITV